MGVRDAGTFVSYEVPSVPGSLLEESGKLHVQQLVMPVVFIYCPGYLLRALLGVLLPLPVHGLLTLHTSESVSSPTRSSNLGTDIYELCHLAQVTRPLNLSFLVCKLEIKMPILEGCAD